MIRNEVRDFVALGPLPDSSADVEVIETHGQALEKISRPISNDEARALFVCFGPDDCFGLAWSLVHLIETAPDWPLDLMPEPFIESASESATDDWEWHKLLWIRVANGRREFGTVTGRKNISEE